MNIAPIVAGVMLVGLSTIREFLVSGLAAHRGDTALAVGNLVGSNMAVHGAVPQEGADRG